MVMFLSDIFIGNTKIFIFTWSGFILPVFCGFLISKFIQKSTDKKYLKLLGVSELAGISSSLIFYIWTNFGHWLTTTMYTKDINGLIECYINAIPFLKPQLAGNLIIVPIFVLATYYILSMATYKKQKLAKV
jgi:hypothetical protein